MSTKFKVGDKVELIFSHVHLKNYLIRNHEFTCEFYKEDDVDDAIEIKMPASIYPELKVPRYIVEKEYTEQTGVSGKTTFSRVKTVVEDNGIKTIDLLSQSTEEKFILYEDIPFVQMINSEYTGTRQDTLEFNGYVCGYLTKDPNIVLVRTVNTIYKVHQSHLKIS